MNITYFRKRIPGAESILEDRIADQLDSLFNHRRDRCWLAGSISLGASRPDLLLVYYVSDVFASTSFDNYAINILAYLRSVGSARSSTIGTKLNIPDIVVNEKLSGLLLKEAIVKHRNNFSVSSRWKEILPEVISIEIKVSNWRRALQQAQLNKAFSHRSYIAVPNSIAEKISVSKEIRASGIGLISISMESSATLLVNPVLRKPKVWSYYYKIASRLACTNQEG